jgi:hypothetical protein
MTLMNLVTELVQEKNDLIEYLNYIYAQMLNTDSLRYKSLLHMNWLYHKQHGIQSLNARIAWTRYILMEELSESSDLIEDIIYNIECKTKPRIQKDRNILYKTCSFSYDRVGILATIPETETISLKGLQADLHFMLYDMNRDASLYIDKLKELNEPSERGGYRTISIYHPPPSNPPASLRKRLCSYFKSMTPGISEKLKLRVYLRYYPISSYNWM